MTEDFLIATASLPMFFPPVKIEGDTYIDAVLNTATNLEEAISRGADELWVIWTTSERGKWGRGFLGNFFGIFEATANYSYRRVLKRIEENNKRIERGAFGEFGRPIKVREIKAEVGLHYLFNFKQRLFPEAVEEGVRAARAWCNANNIERNSAVRSD